MAPSINDASSAERHGGSIWQAAIHDYLEKLKRGGMTIEQIDADLWCVDNPNGLLQQTQGLMPQNGLSSWDWMRLSWKLERVLSKLNYFAAIVTLASGKNSQVSAVMWGSIRIILKLSKPVLPEIITMFEELGDVLPEISQYEQELPMSPDLGGLLRTTYTKILGFYARSITLFQNNPNISKSGHAWITFSSEFPTHMKSLQLSSELVDEEAELIRLSRETKTAESVDAARSLQIDQPMETKLKCHMVPYGRNVKFFGRSDETEALKRELHPSSDCTQMGVIAIHGMGGVGKTQLALHYVSISRKIYDIILWIPADTQIKIAQTLSRFAVEIGIVGDEGFKDDHHSIQRVKAWLDNSGKRFLLIFDNVKREDLLAQLWPTTDNASIIITCRSDGVAYSWATEVVHLQCLDVKAGVDVLHSLTGLEPLNEADALAAEELVQFFGGLPLAIVQVSEFMYGCGFSYDEMLPRFKKSAQRILARFEPPSQYEHTLDTVWNVAFERLSAESKTLLNILSFFDPDLIPEVILTNEKADMGDINLQFLFDEFDFSDVIIDLKEDALVSRSPSQRALSIHRLIQLTAFTRLAPGESSIFLDHAIKLLFYAFPNTWNRETRHRGRGWASWKACSTVLPHVSWLIKLTEEQSLNVKNPEMFAELAFRAGA